MPLEFNKRFLVPEKMDDPNLDMREHQLALRGLRRINQLCKPDRPIADAIIECAQRLQLQSVRVLDLGCGSGDISNRVAQRISSSVHVELVGWDMSETAVQTAQQNASASKNSRWKISFERRNVFEKQNLGTEAFDFVFCSLFLHHFADSQIVALIDVMKRLSTRAVLIDDLCRSYWGWFMAYLGCRLLSRSSVVHFDGPQSVRAALTQQEAQAIADSCGFQRVSIRKHWPERFLMICEH